MSDVFHCEECDVDVIGKPRKNSDFIDCPLCMGAVGYRVTKPDVMIVRNEYPRISELMPGSWTEALETAVKPKPVLPTDAKARKNVPVYSGFLAYFPLAVAAVAELSRLGNEQHNPGSPLHWDREKSGDELDADARHLLDAGTFDTDGARHSVKHAWRAMANLQKELEAARADGQPVFIYHEGESK